MSEATNTVSECWVVEYDSHGVVLEEEFDTIEQAKLFVALVGGDSVVQPYIYRLPR